MLMGNACKSSQCMCGNLVCQYRAQEITIAVVLCKYSHERKLGGAACWRHGGREHHWLQTCWWQQEGKKADGHGRRQHRVGLEEGTAGQSPRADVGNRSSLKNWNTHIDASHSRQPLVKGERLVRYEVNIVMHLKHCNRFV